MLRKKPGTSEAGTQGCPCVAHKATSHASDAPTHGTACRRPAIIAADKGTTANHACAGDSSPPVPIPTPTSATQTASESRCALDPTCPCFRKLNSTPSANPSAKIAPNDVKNIFKIK